MSYSDCSENVLAEMKAAGIDHYLIWGLQLEEMEWRTLHPNQQYKRIEGQGMKRGA